MKILEKSPNIYNQYDFDKNISLDMLNNRLFCTFSTPEDLDSILDNIQYKYDIMYNKIFILEVIQGKEFAITYNVDQNNVGGILGNTILVHRKKETNTLYTINALNTLIKSLNKGVVDTNFVVNWKHYRNCILLTQENQLKQLDTRIHKIIEV